MNITLFLQLLNQLRIYHWNTMSFAEHKAFGRSYDTLNDLIDNLIETFSGKYGRIVGSDGFNIKLENYGGNYLNVIEQYINAIQNIDFSQDPDLQNIQADILIDLQHLKYLLTLK